MHILIIEDNAADLALLAEFLAEQESVPDLHWVTDGIRALDYLRRASPYENAVRPDLILLDLGLPRMSGYDLIKALKGDPALADIPIIVLSTSRNPMDREETETAGANLFLSKPKDLVGYETLVAQLLEKEIPKFVA